MNNTSDGKNPIITVYPRDVQFFKENYPIHYSVLLTLIERGEACITEDAAGVVG